MPGLCGVVDANPHVGSSLDPAIVHLCRYPWHHPAVEAFERGTVGHVAVERTGLAAAPAFARAAHIRVVFDGELYGPDALAPAQGVARGVVAQGREYFSSVHGSFTCAIWDERAEAMTVRGLRAIIERGDETDERESEPRTTLNVTVDRIDALAFEQARMMVQAVGAHGLDGAVEAMLAEGLGEILANQPDVDLPEGIGGPSELELAWRDELRRRRAEGGSSPVQP